MDPKTARDLNNAIGGQPHPLLDWQSKESASIVAWMNDLFMGCMAPPARLIDLGCGSGKHTYQAERMGMDCIGIDISERMIEWAHANRSKYQAQSQFIIASYFDLPFPNGYFDYALFPKNLVECSGKEFGSVVQETARVLKTDGILIMTFRSMVAGERSIYDDTGRRQGSLTIPGRGEYTYPTFYWNQDLAENCIKKAFQIQSVRMIAPGSNTMLWILQKHRGK